MAVASYVARLLAVVLAASFVASTRAVQCVSRGDSTNRRMTKTTRPAGQQTTNAYQRNTHANIQDRNKANTMVVANYVVQLLLVGLAA